VAKPRTKFEAYTFSRSEDISWGVSLMKLVTWPWPCPFQGRFGTGRLRYAM